MVLRWTCDLFRSVAQNRRRCLAFFEDLLIEIVELDISNGLFFLPVFLAIPLFGCTSKRKQTAGYEAVTRGRKRRRIGMPSYTALFVVLWILGVVVMVLAAKGE